MALYLDGVAKESFREQVAFEMDFEGWMILS